MIRAEVTSSTAGNGPPLSIAVVGCGYWGLKHVRVLNGLFGVGTVYATDVDEGRRRAAAAAFPNVRVGRDLAAVLAEVDAVVVATPPSDHTAVALWALRAGKHVLVEKPLTTSLDDARRLVSEARRQRTVLMVGHTFQFNPALGELRKRIEANELGKIHYIHSARLNLGIHRSDVDIVWDLAPHDISIMNYLLGSSPTSVAAWSSSLAHQGQQDLAYLKIEFGDVGATGYAHLSWLDPRKVRQVTIVGSHKMAVFDDLAEDRLRIFDRGIESAGDAARGQSYTYRYSDTLAPHIDDAEPLALQAQQFVESIRSGAPVLSSGESGLRVVSVLEALSKSLVTNRAVRVDRNPTFEEVPAFEELAV